MASCATVGMTEEEARDWVAARWGEAAADRLDALGRMVVQENASQNLIAPSTTSSMWTRHLLDSAQLVPLATPGATRWLDIGTGAGFPGLVVSLLCPGTTLWLVEPRRRRVDFLCRAAAALNLTNVRVEQCKVEALEGNAFDVVTARAVASADELLRLTSHLRHKATRYVLPRGRSGREEVESLRAQWQGLFHVEQSLTDPESTIIVADGVA
jgi:16S rRNA (guanine527-N7)-methyltransferase